MGIEERGILIRRSRISYLYNYLLIVLVVFFFLLFWYRFNLTFSFLPRTFEEFWKTFVTLGLVGLIAFLFEEPVIERWFRHYRITNNEVIMTEGILRKNRIIIPYQSISNVDVYKGIVGRILDFGDVTVVGFKNQIIMQGIRSPEVFYRIINNKISIMRGTKQVVAREKIRPKKKIKKEKGWREREKALRKELEKEEKGGKKEKKKRRLSLIRRRERKESEEPEEATAEE